MVCGMALCSRFMRRKTPGRDSERGRGAHSSAWQPCGFQGPRLILQKLDGVLSVIFEMGLVVFPEALQGVWGSGRHFYNPVLYRYGRGLHYLHVFKAIRHFNDHITTSLIILTMQNSDRSLTFSLRRSIEMVIPSATTNPPEIRWRAVRGIRTEYERWTGDRPGNPDESGIAVWGLHAMASLTVLWLPLGEAGL